MLASRNAVFTSDVNTVCYSSLWSMANESSKSSIRHVPVASTSCSYTSVCIVLSFRLLSSEALATASDSLPASLSPAQRRVRSVQGHVHLSFSASSALSSMSASRSVRALSTASPSASLILAITSFFPSATCSTRVFRLDMEWLWKNWVIVSLGAPVFCIIVNSVVWIRALSETVCM